jgi:hypothetical protein
LWIDRFRFADRVDLDDFDEAASVDARLDRGLGWVWLRSVAAGADDDPLREDEPASDDEARGVTAGSSSSNPGSSPKLKGWFGEANAAALSADRLPGTNSTTVPTEDAPRSNSDSDGISGGADREGGLGATGNSAVGRVAERDRNA